MTSICIYEDEGYKNLLPISWLKPTFDIFCGMSTLFEKVRRYYPRVNTYLYCRDYLTDIAHRKYPGTIINKLGKETSMLFLNGRVIVDKELLKTIPVTGPDEIFECENRIVAVRLSKDNLELLRPKLSGAITDDLFKKYKDKIKVTEVNVRFIDFYYDLIKENGREIENDFADKAKGGLIKGRLHQTSVLTPKGRIFIDDGSNIGPFTVLDAKDGPIYIGKGVNIYPHTLIEGPVYIGDRAVILGGRIGKNTSIGQYSKVAGEVTATIIQGYSNKQHYGFIGHSYIGEWVNLGAGTTTSNVKNNYGKVKIKYMDNEIDSKETFLGAAIADHAKTGIGTLIGSGSVFGIAANIFGGGTAPKFLPSFYWGSNDKFELHNIDKAIKTAGIAMKRRGVDMTEAEAILFRKIFEMTESERKYLNI